MHGHGQLGACWEPGAEEQAAQNLVPDQARLLQAASTSPYLQPLLLQSQPSPGNIGSLEDSVPGTDCDEFRSAYSTCRLLVQ